MGLEALREEDEKELILRNSPCPLLMMTWTTIFITACFAFKLSFSLWMFGLGNNFKHPMWGGSPDPDLCKIPIGRLAFICFFPGFSHAVMMVTLAKYIGDALTEFDDYDAIMFPCCVVRKKYRVKAGFELKGVMKQGVLSLDTQKSLTQQPSIVSQPGTESRASTSILARSPPSSSSDSGNNFMLPAGSEFKAVKKALDGIDPKEKFIYTDVRVLTQSRAH